MRALFRGVGRANNDDAGDLRFKCDRDEVGGTRRKKISVTPEATHGPCHNGRKSRWNSLAILSADGCTTGSLSLPSLRATAVPRAVSSLSLTLSPLVLHSSGRLSRLLRCTDVAIRLRARETRVRDVASHLRQRIRQRVVFALCVTLRLWHPDPGGGIVGSLSLFLSFSPGFSLSPFPTPALFPPFVVGPGPALISRRTMRPAAAQKCPSVCDNALSRRDASRVQVNMA